MGSFSDYSAAAQMKSLTTRLVEQTIQRIRPAYTYAIVTSIDRINRRATVQFPDEESGDSVVMMGGIQPLNVGQTVRIDGRPGDRFISDVMGPIYAPGRFSSVSAYADLPSTSYTLAAEDDGVTYLIPQPSDSDITVPDDDTVGIPIGFSVSFIGAGLSNAEFTRGSGVVIRGNNPATIAGDLTRFVGGRCTLTKVGTDNWILDGEIAPPSCRVYKTGEGTADSTWEYINFDGENYDDWDMHSLVTNTGRITIPSGWVNAQYLIIAYVDWAYTLNGGVREARIVVNGSTYYYFQSSTVTIDPGGSGAISLSLSGGDYIQLQCMQTSGSNLNVTTARLQCKFDRLAEAI